MNMKITAQIEQAEQVKICCCSLEPGGAGNSERATECWQAHQTRDLDAPTAPPFTTRFPPSLLLLAKGTPPGAPNIAAGIRPAALLQACDAACSNVAPRGQLDRSRAGKCSESPCGKEVKGLARGCTGAEPPALCLLDSSNKCALLWGVA
jgi:hypothetical protein